MVVAVLAGCQPNTPTLTEHQKKQAALDGYNLAQNGQEVSTSFLLPKTIGGYSVVWTSSNDGSLKLVEEDSTYTAEPILGNSAVPVTLTATIDTAVRTFSLTVAKKVVDGGDIGDGGDQYVADNTEYYNEITKSFKLTKAYVGKSFFEDGIGEAVVDTNGLTDGDTTRFRLLIGNTTVTIRYYMIDTPESTGSVEKWGAAASKYNKQQLSAATKIVLEATSTPPSHDSYGTRYLGYVWYKTADDEDFQCLNLEMVENGFSPNKGIATSAYPYNDVFQKAHDFAKSIQLRFHSKLDDPLYSKDPVPMTIASFNDNPYQYYNIEHEVGSKVIFEAYITSLKLSNADNPTYTFTAAQYDPETNTVSTVSVYTMYVSKSASQNLKIGGYYKFVGTVQKYYDNWQISDITFSAIKDSMDTTNLRQLNYYLIFDSSAPSKWSSNWDTNTYSDLTVTEVVGVTDGVLTFKGTAKLHTEDTVWSDTVSEFTFKVKVADNYNNAIAVGKTLTLSALQLDVTNAPGIFTILNYSDITIKS